MNLALLICLVGLIVYVIFTRVSAPPVSEIGRIMFWVGLLAYLLGSGRVFGPLIR